LGKKIGAGAYGEQIGSGLSGLGEDTVRHFLRENALVIIVIAVMVGGYLFLRTPGDELASTAEFEAQVTGGMPTLVEFYSNT
jgi:hypothetical protein